MEKSNYLVTYLLVFLACVAVTAAIMVMLNHGIKKYFSTISQDPEIAGFFTRLTLMVIFFGGIGGAIAAHYDTGENANWLTLTWDAAAHIKESLQQLFIALMILSIAFIVLLIIDKRSNK